MANIQKFEVASSAALRNTEDDLKKAAELTNLFAKTDRTPKPIVVAMHVATKADLQASVNHAVEKGLCRNLPLNTISAVIPVAKVIVAAVHVATKLKQLTQKDIL